MPEDGAVSISCNVDGRLLGGSFAPQTVLLDALRQLSVPVNAACSGAGTCGKCKVMVRCSDSADAREVLACQTPIRDGMMVMSSTPVIATVDSGVAAVPVLEARGDDGDRGIAVDLGTTTIVCRLVDLHTGRIVMTAAAANPQVLYGADVASRISAAVSGALPALTGLVRSTVASLAREMLAREMLTHEMPGRLRPEVDPGGRTDADAAHAAHGAKTLDMVVAGNTVMESLFAGIDPAPIGVAPYVPADLLGRYVGLPGDGGDGEVTLSAYVVPAVSGYIGGDIVADIVAAGMSGTPLSEAAQSETVLFEAGEKPVLLLDLGTNAEIALLHDGRITCCATAAGPSFEGAEMAMGMNAVDGAIASARLGNDGFEVEVIGGGTPRGICGTGYIDIIAELLDGGVLDESGLLAQEDDSSHVLLGREDGVRVTYLSAGRDVYVTQKDIRSFQLGKAAVATGITMLLESCGVDSSEVGTLLVAGGFGRYLDLRSAARVGMIPTGLVSVARAVGNLSIEGATMALVDGVDGKVRHMMEDIRSRMEVLELSAQPGFNRRFMDELSFTHQEGSR